MMCPLSEPDHETENGKSEGAEDSVRGGDGDDINRVERRSCIRLLDVSLSFFRYIDVESILTRSFRVLVVRLSAIMIKLHTFPLTCLGLSFSPSLPVSVCSCSSYLFRFPPFVTVIFVDCCILVDLKFAEAI